MALKVGLTETSDILVLTAHFSEVGDVFDVPAGISYAHCSMLGAGRGTLTINRAVAEYAAPSIVILPLYTAAKVKVIEAPLIIYCIYNKHTAGALDDVRLWVDALESRTPPPIVDGVEQ